MTKLNRDEDMALNVLSKIYKTLNVAIEDII